MGCVHVIRFKKVKVNDADYEIKIEIEASNPQNCIALFEYLKRQKYYES